jgi:DNA-binding PadR family transcriptional regulator
MREGGGLGGRRGRVFDHGDLRLVVLQLIAEKPRHGYEIIKAVEELVGGAYSPSPGVIYPTLTMLEDLGHATVTEQDGKKLHALTDQGRAYLEENRPAVEALQARMAQIAGSRAKTRRLRSSARRRT